MFFGNCSVFRAYDDMTFKDCKRCLYAHKYFFQNQDGIKNVKIYGELQLGHKKTLKERSKLVKLKIGTNICQ
jgi:hypothetical protein